MHRCQGLVFLISRVLVLSHCLDIFKQKKIVFFLMSPLSKANLKGLGTLCRIHKTVCPQTHNKLAPFEDNGGRKFPLKYYLLKCCSLRN